MNSSDERRRYRAAERFIASREFFGMKLGLDNVRGFVASIGSPQEAFPTAHVAGTNGKGSTVMMLGSVLRESGYKTGVFTSPHLIDFRERIRVDGRKIEKRYVTRWIERHKSEIKAKQITYFEVMVALALSYFKSRKVDIAVVETGLGGRLDATNILAPILTIVTEISLDHVSILGDTLNKIAGEKAGIIKPHTHLVIAEMPASARLRLESTAKKLSAPIVPLVSSRIVRREAQHLSLAGPHQVENARNVISAVRLLKKKGYNISETSLAIGLQSVRWRGRFQKLKTRSGVPIILDVGHNLTGLEALVATFKECYPGKKVRIVAGFVRNKDHKSLINILQEIAAEFILTQLPTHRSVDPTEFLPYLRTFSGPITVKRTAKSAFRTALKEADPMLPILIVGSHFLVGEFLRNSPHK